MTKRKIIKVPEGEICDYIDGKFRKDTSEEYVRQTIEKRLVNEHKYDPKRIKIEFYPQTRFSPSPCGYCCVSKR